MEYYISIDNEKQGPYSLQELEERSIQATTLVMPAGGTRWIPAWQIEELRRILEGNASTENQTGTEGVPFVEATPIAQSAPSATDVPLQPLQKRGHTGCLPGILITLVVVAAVLILTCPKPEQHKEVLSSVITATVNDAANDSTNTTGNELIDNAVRSISNAFAGKVVEAAVDNLVTVDNYVVCSLGKVNYNGKDYVVSLGLLGHIFTVDEDDLQKAAEQYYKKSEINVKEQIRQKAQKMLQENIIAPAASAIEGLLGSAMDGLLDEIGLDNQPSKPSKKKTLEADSI